MKKEVTLDDIIQELLENKGVPKNVKTSIEESLSLIKDLKTEEEKISCLISILDDASNDPNISSYARTQIWNMVSILESMKNKSKLKV